MGNFSNFDKAYGLQNSLQSLAPRPIVAQRAPTTSDKAAVGTTWVDTSAANVYILAQYAAGLATWNLLEAGGGGGVFATLHVTGTSALDGAVTAGSTLQVTGLATLTGGATTPANLVTTGTGSITSNTSITATTTVTAGTGITSTTGSIKATAGQVIAGGDVAGQASTTSLTNATQAPGAIANTLVGTNGGQTNAGYLKFYQGVTAVYVPYFTAP